MLDLMIDLETLSTEPGSVVTSLGAVFFDPTRAKVVEVDHEHPSVLDLTDAIGQDFETTLAIQPQLNVGLKISESALRWWMLEAPVVSRTYMLASPGEPGQALSDFEMWASCHSSWKKLRIWGNGANFDPPLLEAVYRAFGRTPPWDSWQARCFRTLKSIGRQVKTPMRDTALLHCARADARHQAVHACHIIKELGLTTW